MKLSKKEIRKSIKKLAFEDPKGVLIKALVCIIFIYSIFSFALILLGKTLNINYNTVIYNNLVYLISFTLISPLILNFSRMALMNCRDEIYDIKDLFIFNKLSFKFMSYYFLINLFCLFVSYLFSLSFVGSIFNLVLLIILLPVFFVVPYVFLDDNCSFKELILKSFKIVNKKRVEFFGMILSFSLWFILGLLTLGILYLWLIPYVYISLTYLYLNLKKEKSFKKEKHLSNLSIIIIFVIVVLFIDIFSFVNFKGSFSDFKSYFGIYNYEKVSDYLYYGDSKIKYYVPADYKITSSTNTSKTYTNNNIVQYSIYLSSVADAIEMDKAIIKEYKNSSEYKKVNEEEFVVKINKKKIKCYKFDALKNNGDFSSQITTYIPKKNFILTISLISDSKLSKRDIEKFIIIQ